MIHNSLFTRLHQLFFFLTLVFLPTQLGYHFWPSWSMVLGRRVDYLSPTLFLTDIFIILTLLFWFFEVVTKKELRITKYELRKNKSFLWIGILVVFVIVNITAASRVPVAIYHWIKLFEYLLFGVYIVKTKPSLFIIHTSLFIAILYSSLIAIVQFVFQHSIGGPLWFLGERTFTIDTPGIARSVIHGKDVLRAYATFPHPNVFAGFLVAVLPLFLMQVFSKISYVWRRIYIGVLLLGTIALALTASRSAWVVYLVSMCWVWYVHKKHHGISMLAVALAVGYFAISPLSSSDESIVVRAQLNWASISMIQDHPWLGVGLGNFLVALPDFLPSRTIYFLQPVHNIYLLLVSEVGVVGIGFVLYFLYLLLRYELKIKNYEKRIFSVIRNSLFSILLLGLVDHYVLTLQQGRLLLTLFVGLAVSHAFSQKRRVDAGRRIKN
jgi:hypothetical protein